MHSLLTENPQLWKFSNKVLKLPFKHEGRSWKRKRPNMYLPHILPQITLLPLLFKKQAKLLFTNLH